MTSRKSRVCSLLVLALPLLSSALFSACGGEGASLAGSPAAARVDYLLPGPNQPGYDPVLEQKANRYDRQHLILNCAGNGINADAVVSLARPDDRRLIEDFLRTTDGWDFEAWSGKPVFEVITDYQKVAGLYAGVGIAADAYRYGTLRDQGYPGEEINRAREFLERGI